jgi:hypothetical protein
VQIESREEVNQWTEEFKEVDGGAKVGDMSRLMQVLGEKLLRCRSVGK